LVTGAADDDPSGIATYSQAGAKFGYELGWTVVLTYPLMVAVQMISARLGRVTGRGLADNVREHFPAPVLYALVIMLLVANMINVAADVAAMGQSLQLVIGGPAQAYTVAFGVICLVLEVYLSYRRYVAYLKWLTLVLFAYVVTAFIVSPNWGQVLRATFVPDIRFTRDYLSVLVGILGTSISPYLFFWQAAQEVEEERAEGKTTVAQRQGASMAELRRARNDVVTGMFFSNFVMYFIILTTGATLHAHGITHIGTASQAAEALRPLAGNGAYWLFTAGLIGTGMLGVPVLAGSSAFAISEAMAWGASLDRKPRLAPKFYAVLAIAMALGVVLDFVGLDSVKMLFWSAILNGVLAPPLIVLVVLLSTDRTVMGEHVSPPLLKWLGWITAAVMTAAAVAMFIAS